jgi:hypothetical protein
MIILVSVLLAVTLAVGGSIAMAAQPLDKGKPQHAGEGNQTIQRPNGFPAGPHFNLNIHGKKDGYNCNTTTGGGSVFVLEYGPATIQYVSNKKSSVENLTVLDPCAGFDGDPALVQLPKAAEGYYVFGRILGKPNHGKDGNASSVILYPNVVTQACNDTGDPDFENWTSCDPLLALGFILRQDIYVVENETYVRFDPGVTKGKGKSKATDITALFTYVGWVVHPDLDISGPNGTPDGVIDEYDIPEDDYDNNNATAPNRDYNNDGFIDEVDVEDWLTDMAALDPPMAWYFSEEDGMWIFNIADLVVTEQGLVNDGTKLLQIRFYPKDGTTFE